MRIKQACVQWCLLWKQTKELSCYLSHDYLHVIEAVKTSNQQTSRQKTPFQPDARKVLHELVSEIFFFLIINNVWQSLTQLVVGRICFHSKGFIFSAYWENFGKLNLCQSDTWIFALSWFLLMCKCVWLPLVEAGPFPVSLISCGLCAGGFCSYLGNDHCNTTPHICLRAHTILPLNDFVTQHLTDVVMLIIAYCLLNWAWAACVRHEFQAAA